MTGKPTMLANERATRCVLYVLALVLIFLWVSPARPQAATADVTQAEWSQKWGDWLENWRGVDYSRIPVAERLDRAVELLAQLELLIAAAPNPGQRSVVELHLAEAYFKAGNWARFHAGRPRQAAELYAASAKHGEFVGAIGLADVRRFDLHDVPGAIDAYRQVEQNVKSNQRARRSDPQFAKWVSQWIAHEIRFLTSGQRFAGRLAAWEVEESGFSLMHGAFTDSIWPGAGDAFRTMERYRYGDDIRPYSIAIAKELPKLPRSSLTLIYLGYALVWIDEYEVLVSLLDRNDPTGYLSATFIGKLRLIETRLDFESLRKDEMNQLALFGAMYLFAPGQKVAPIVSIAGRYFRERNIDFQLPILDPRMTTPEGTWGVLLEALRTGDVPKALECFSPTMRSTLESRFSGMSPSQLRAMADSFDGFKLGERSGQFHEFVVTRQGEGSPRIAFGSFVRIGKLWKIESM